MDRVTDSREKGRIGIFGTTQSYAGSSGRVTHELIGRDLNPLGRGDGNAYVAGALNLGRISPAIPQNSTVSGTGSSVNNQGQCGGGSCGELIPPGGGIDDDDLIPPDPSDPGFEADPWFDWDDPNKPPQWEPLPPWQDLYPPIEIEEPVPGGGTDPYDPKCGPIWTRIVAGPADPCDCCWRNIPPGTKVDGNPIEGDKKCRGAGANFDWPNAGAFCCMWAKGSKYACKAASDACVIGCLFAALGTLISWRLLSLILSYLSTLLDAVDFNWEALIEDVIGWIITSFMGWGAGLALALARLWICLECCETAYNACLALSNASFCVTPSGDVIDFTDFC